MSHHFPHGLKRLPIAAAVLGALLLTPALALAQDAQTDDAQQQASQQSNQQNETADKAEQSAQARAKELSTVTVTGSLIQQPRNESVAPVQTVVIEQEVKTGAFDTASIITGTAAASGSTVINGQFGGYVVEGGTGVQTIDLRGLGANRTLVLLDGQRPGPAGTRGQVGAFDLNVIPVSIISRVDIVKDGSSSIYGSDAIAGVVNLITKKEVDGPTVTLRASSPQHGGGEQYMLSFADGWSIDNGNFVLAAQVDKQQAMTRGDRDYLSCTRDRFWGADGNRADVPDHSINAGTPYAGCNYMLMNRYMHNATGNMFVPSADGSTGPLSIIPGYVLHQPAGYDPGEVPYTDAVTDAAFLRDAYVIQKRKRASLYLASNLYFGNVGWNTEVLYNYRKTQEHGYRQFFPWTYYPFNQQPQGIYRLIMPFPSDSDVKVSYFYGATKLTGIMPWTESWSWETNVTYSRSSGIYSTLGIDGRISGDLSKPGQNQVTFPPIDLYKPGFLNGDNMQQLVDTFGLRSTGHTIYKQATANVLFTGDLFDGWAGTARAAFGAEFRHMSLNDTPSEASQNGWLWGSSSAGITNGTDNVKEAFAQIGIPLLEGVPGAEKLSLDLSGRAFRYQSVDSSGDVWRLGMNWQITPTVRVRGTLGTSYKAPTLFQLYLADQTGFVGQLSIDPCIQWGQSNNQTLRANCAALGIPDTYTANGYASATSHSGGGDGFLDPEKSRAKTLGVVWTPSFANMSLSINYFDYQINGEIAKLGVGTITSACYGSTAFPNRFCDQIERNPSTAANQPNMITDVYATYININRQRQRGYDLFGQWAGDFSFGRLDASLDVVYTLSDITQYFSTAAESGFTSGPDRIGYIGNPRTTAVANLAWSKGDWSANWQGRYVSSTYNRDVDPQFNLYGNGPLVTLDRKAGWQIRHDVSVSFDQPTWGITAGIRNVFDKAPDLISPSAGTTIGNAPLYASQYDWFGRTFFANFNIKL